MQKFLKTESAAGMAMIAAALLALVAVNSPLATLYHSFISFKLTLGYGAHTMQEPLEAWVKDVLMVFFFLVVGMELKQEMKEGFLANRDQLLLPLLCALGGMAIPAIIFLTINHTNPATVTGWAIPSATDIAFALCILGLAGRNIPSAAKVFLLAIAIFDDLGAIFIIAIFYSTELAPIPLLLVLAGFGLLVLLNWRGVTSVIPYLAVGIGLWFCLHAGGIHTTIAGVAVGLAIPMRQRDGGSPLRQFLHRIHPWVAFGVLPLFAFSSAGISFAGISFSDLLKPLPLGIMLGLFAGKQIGIFGVARLACAVGVLQKPAGVDWWQLYGVAVIAGIGFTMSLFIGLLAFPGSHMQEMVKLGVVSGSLLSALWGFIVLRYASRRG